MGPGFARCAPFALFVAFIAFAGVPADLLAHMPFDQRWIPASRGIFVAAVLVFLWPMFRELRGRANWPFYRDACLGIVVGLAVFVLWVNLDQPWATLGTTQGFDPRSSDGAGFDWPLVLARILGLALVVPVMEELFWRSFLLRWLQQADFATVEPASVGARAILVSSALFALEHNQWLAGAIAGFAYNWLYIRTGNLWVPIIAHAVTNAVLGAWILATGHWQFW
jgi:CAAX prenyl protease-like protein